MSKKVLLAMSGGVDSSVSAFLLKEEGYNVIGVTLELFMADKCSSINNAKDVADRIGIEHYILDCKDEFKKEVINYFLDEYMTGRTPNPCVVCNSKIKFGILLKKAEELRADYIATGHYAKVEKINGRFTFRKALDARRDQSYFLYRLSQYNLSRSIMPLWKKKKEDVRRIAKSLNLKVYNKPDSQEICFIPDRDYRSFIRKSLLEIEDGIIIDKEGNLLGKHKGIYLYTIGQRKGLGIALKKPLYVIGIDRLKKAIIVGEKQESSASLVAKDLNFLGIESLVSKMKVMARIRYQHKETEATITPISNSKVNVSFKEPQKAITPGQSVVFYKDDLIIGGGVIC
ncbi:MAG: tRNA 2-thiouridine(34) synthase MnmA [bacterium]|nr:tRNA 2-thiouridine(34) synthase MnmA [bacterium]